jgi:hypothetical protein
LLGLGFSLGFGRHNLSMASSMPPLGGSFMKKLPSLLQKGANLASPLHYSSCFATSSTSFPCCSVCFTTALVTLRCSSCFITHATSFLLLHASLLCGASLLHCLPKCFSTPCCFAIPLCSVFHCSLAQIGISLASFFFFFSCNVLNI